MNHILTQLAEQARQYATTRHPVSNIVLNVDSCVFEQQFAELIVRECASTCYKIFDNGDQIALVLLNTFGVTPDE
jgi:hypothetical protein